MDARKALALQNAGKYRITQTRVVTAKTETRNFGNQNSTLRYECDETFSDECEFAARAEGE